MVSKGLATSSVTLPAFRVNVPFTKSASFVKSGSVNSCKAFSGRDLYRHLEYDQLILRGANPIFHRNAFASEFTVDDHGTMRCGNGSGIIFGCVVYYDHLAYVWVCVAKCDY